MLQKKFMIKPQQLMKKLYLRCFWNSKINEGQTSIPPYQCQIMIVSVSFMHTVPTSKCKHARLILPGVCTPSLLNQIFCWKFRLWWNSLLSLAWPHTSIVCPMILKWSVGYFFIWKLFARIWSVILSFFSNKKEKSLTGTIQLKWLKYEL